MCNSASVYINGRRVKPNPQVVDVFFRILRRRPNDRAQTQERMIIMHNYNNVIRYFALRNCAEHNANMAK
jgi:hypothetical protein